MTAALQSEFAEALRDPSRSLPSGVISHTSPAPQKRFAVYRNNVTVGLIGALEARFPATKRIVGEAFFTAAARLYASAHPPRSPLMMTYGDEFPDFLHAFEPAADVPYLADVARLEAARTRAYHAADANPLEPAALAEICPDALAGLHVILHPSVEIVASTFPIVTIWAMNAGEMELAPLADWPGEDALVARPALDVEVRRLPAGAAAFLQGLAAGRPLGAAAESGFARSADFELAINLAALFSTGLAIEATHEPAEDFQP
jgi:hypothetical protein